MIFKQELSPQNGHYTPLLCFHLGYSMIFYKASKDHYLPTLNSRPTNYCKIVHCVRSLGSSYVTALNWDFYLRFLSRAFDGFSGLGKHFYVNGTQIFSSEMHPRSGIQAQYIHQDSNKKYIERRHPFKFLFLPKTGLLGSQAITRKKKSNYEL